MKVAQERLLQLIRKDSITGCWNFIGSLGVSGYGKFVYSGKVRRAHRVAYEFWCKPIQTGFHLHHVCENRCCCNPEHLSPMTSSVHARISVNLITYKNSRKTHCPRGHELIDGNLEESHRKAGKRKCLICEKERLQRRSRALGYNQWHPGGHGRPPKDRGIQ